MTLTLQMINRAAQVMYSSRGERVFRLHYWSTSSVPLKHGCEAAGLEMLGGLAIFHEAQTHEAKAKTWYRPSSGFSASRPNIVPCTPWSELNNSYSSKTHIGIDNIMTLNEMNKRWARLWMQYEVFSWWNTEWQNVTNIDKHANTMTVSMTSGNMLSCYKAFQIC